MKRFFLLTVIMCFFATMQGINNQQTKFHLANNATLIIEKGDIAKCQVEAIVNAANEQLLGGAGVCGAIFNSAGWQKLQKACDKYPSVNGIRCATGQAKITDSFGLKPSGIHYIIHAVGPDCRIVKDEKTQNLLLEQAYKNSLTVADKNSIRSIAFPFISSAIYAFPKERAAQIALKTVVDYTKNNNTGLSAVHFVLFSQADFDLFYRTAQEII